MDIVPKRRVVTIPYRTVTVALERTIRLPKVNPAFYQVVAIVASLTCLYTDSPWLKFGLIALILLTDWLDGATVRQHGQPGRPGYIMDIVIDRASEVIIFTGEAGSALGNLFFLLSLANIGLAYYSLKSGKHTSLPLRCAWLFVLGTQALAT